MTQSKRMAPELTRSSKDEARALELGFDLTERSDANSLRFHLEFLNSSNRRDMPSHARRRLLQLGLIKCEHPRGGKTIYGITPKGAELLEKTRTRRPRV